MSTVRRPGPANPADPLIPARPWARNHPPKRVLAIRLQAMGDVVICLPYLQDLRKDLPSSVRLDFLTRVETEGIPQNIVLFDKVITIGGGRNFKMQFLHTLWLLPRLLFRRYDVVIDLQNNVLSRLVTKVLRPEAWCAFDRYSPQPAGERCRLTIEAVGLQKSRPGTHPKNPGTHPKNPGARFRLKKPDAAATLLEAAGWSPDETLVVLNPAGAFQTRNWDLDRYVAFAELWERDFPRTRFLVLGTPFIEAKAAYLSERLGTRLLNLVGKTSTEEAFAILQRAAFVLSEDSGLMHMAWTSGVPTMALFGSTRSDWSRPLGAHTFYLDSSDLTCGHCMESFCRLGDTRCMTRYTPEQVYRHAVSLISKTSL